MSKFSIEQDTLLEKVNNIIDNNKGFNSLSKLDGEISLLADFILLAALEDDIIKTKVPEKRSGDIVQTVHYSANTFNGTVIFL